MSVFSELQKKTTKRQKQNSERFFKTGPGSYSAHDFFVGINMPAIRSIAQTYIDIKDSELQKLVSSKYHEYRMCGFIILTYRYKRADKPARRKIYNFYIKNLRHVNNWDLVDVTIPNIVGEYIKENKGERKKIENLCTSKDLWERRVSVLACFPMIKDGEFAMFLKIANRLLSDQEDLMHKAVGWMLREVYKKDERVARTFIDKNYVKIPRTTLRYAIEKMDAKERKVMLNRKYS